MSFDLGVDTLPERLAHFSLKSILARGQDDNLSGSRYSRERAVCRLMKFEPFPVSRSSGRFTNLSVRISEEEDGYTVQVRLYSQAMPENAAWGEETADSLETASMMVEALAAEFSISQAQIKIEIRMQDPRDGTRH